MRGGGAGRGEVVPQTVGDDLVQAHGVVDVLERELSEVSEGCLWELPEQARGRVGEKDLLAPRGGADARSKMDVAANVAFGRDDRLAGVDPQADAELSIVGPGMRGEGALGRERAGEASWARWKA